MINMDPVEIPAELNCHLWWLTEHQQHNMQSQARGFHPSIEWLYTPMSKLFVVFFSCKSGTKMVKEINGSSDDVSVSVSV